MITLPCKHQVGDEVIMKAFVTGVTFSEGKVFYNITFVDHNGIEDEENPILGVPSEYMFPNLQPHLKTDSR